MAARCSRPPGPLPARRLGHPDMPNVVARVLATRGTGPRQAPAHRIRSETLAAAALALTDPEAARHVLRAIESRSYLDASTLGRLAGEHWLTAWALVDLDHAESLVEAELTALEGGRRGSRTDWIAPDGRGPRHAHRPSRGVSPARHRRHLVPGIPLLRCQAAGALRSPHSTSPQTFGDWNPAGFGRPWAARPRGRRRRSGRGAP